MLGKISNILFEVQPYSNLPYQHIIEQLPIKRVIQTMFTLDEYQATLVPLGQASAIELCSIYSLNDNDVQTEFPRSAVAMFDIGLSMEHIVDAHSLRAELTVSSDLFDSATTVKIARQFSTYCRTIVLIYINDYNSDKTINLRSIVNFTRRNGRRYTIFTVKFKNWKQYHR